VGNSVNKRKEQKMFELRIDTKNSSFQNKKSSIQEMLKSVILDIQNDKKEGIIRDVNGKIVGRFSLGE
jgi:hypothetical protein